MQEHTGSPLVGHDMGGIVAYAFARQFPGDLGHLSIVDTPIPGLSGWQELRTQTPRWHWLFHSLPDLPEALVSGKERVYLEWFLRNLATTRRRSRTRGSMNSCGPIPGPLPCTPGSRDYRAFDQDEKDNQDYARAKLPMPVLAVGGERSRLNKDIIDQLGLALSTSLATSRPAAATGFRKRIRSGLPAAC